MKEMKVIGTNSFINTIADIHQNADHRKFCFVIGAGASFNSGIKTGKHLAEGWFKEISTRLEYEKKELQDWITKQNVDTNNLAASYGSIYKKRFENDKVSGYDFLSNTMKDAKPSYGYIILAQILSKYRGHCVVTTNFDSLVESSIFQFTDTTPLSCGHESLSVYARPDQPHPLIVKIHRDLLMAPLNVPDEIDKIDEAWIKPLDHIFNTHIPIVIGYGGNDGSLMGYFEKMNTPSNFFWCDLNIDWIPERTKQLIIKHDGKFVTIDGFDELMNEMTLAFSEVNVNEGVFEKFINKRTENFRQQKREIDLKKEKRRLEKEKLSSNTEKETPLSALEFGNLIDKETNIEKKKEIYLKALDKYPTTGWLWWEFSYYLHFTAKDYDGLDLVYENALKYNNLESGIFGNFAIYNEFIKKDYNKAEEFYLKSINIETPNIFSYGNYANFLKVVRKDYENANLFYQKAIEANPKDFVTIGNFANFLKEIKKDYNAAEVQYLNALEIEPNNAINLNNYAYFLEGIKKDFDKAEMFYLKALIIEPPSSNINNDYANFLNYTRKNFNKAEEYYNKAIMLDDKNAAVLGSYAAFLYHRKKNYDASQAMYSDAIPLDPNNIFNSINYGIFLSTIKKDYVTAKDYYLKALNADPENVSFNRYYAQYLLEQGDVANAEKYIDIAIKNGEENETLLESWFFRYAFYPTYLKDAENKIKDLLDKKLKSDDLSLEQIIKVALEKGHVNPDKLEEFAERITSK
jgi:protein O-mannosyl-transferase